jgi:DNA-binding CsgD family transcriptional regulator
MKSSEKIYDVWKKFEPQISKRELPFSKTQIDSLTAEIFSNGPSYFYILDLSNMKISNVSCEIKHIHGLQPEETIFQDILDLIHPDDMEYISKAETKAFELARKIGPEKFRKYKISYCFRLRNAEGSYELFNHQAINLTADENGAMAKALNIHTNISHLSCTNTFKLSAIGMFGEPSYLNIDVGDKVTLPDSSAPVFSKREIQIIRLMADGCTSQDIANKLFIAHDTVKNHRKKILSKSGSKNIGHLIARCITGGLL